MKKMIKRILDSITAPFVALVVHIGTSKEINEDGTWDKYFEKKNGGAK